MGVGFPQQQYLVRFGELVADYFGHMPYHVGSSLKLKSGWRDVDVRLLLPDDEYDALFTGDNGMVNHRWAPLCMAWSALGEKMTGLPIDFQIQKLTEANKDDGPRSVIGSVQHHYGRSV